MPITQMYILQIFKYIVIVVIYMDKLVILAKNELKTSFEREF